MTSRYMPPAMRRAAISNTLFQWDNGRTHRAANEQDENANDTTLVASSSECVTQDMQQPTATAAAAAMLPALPASIIQQSSSQQSTQWAQFPRVAALLQRLSRDSRLKNHTPLALLNEYAAKEHIELSYDIAADTSCGYRVTSRMRLPQAPMKVIEGVGRGRSKAAAKQECAVCTLQTVLEILPDGEFLKWHLKDIPDFGVDDGAVNSMDNVLSALRGSAQQADERNSQEPPWHQSIPLRDSEAVDADPKTWSDFPYVAALMQRLQVNPRLKDKTPLALLHEYVAKNHQDVDYSTVDDSAIGPYTVTATIGSHGVATIAITGSGRGRNKVKAKQAAAAAALEQLLQRVPSSAEELSKPSSSKTQKFLDRMANAHTGLGFGRDGAYRSHRSDLASWRGRSQCTPQFVSPRFEPRFLYKADIDRAGTVASKTQQDYSCTYNQYYATGAGLGFSDAAADTSYHQPAQQQQQYYYSDPAAAAYSQQYATVAQDMAAWPAFGNTPPSYAVSGQHYATAPVQAQQQQASSYQYTYQYQYQ